MELPGSSENTNSSGSKQLTGFRPIKISQAPKPPSTPTEEEETKFSDFSAFSSQDLQAMGLRTSSPSRSSPSSGRNIATRLVYGQEETICVEQESAPVNLNVEELRLRSPEFCETSDDTPKDPGASTRAGSPLAAAAMSRKLLTMLQDSGRYDDLHCSHGVPTSEVASHSNNDAYLPTVPGHKVAWPLSQRLERRSSPTGPPTVLLSQSARSPLFRRQTNRARQEQEGRGDTPSGMLRRMRRKQQPSRTCGASAATTSLFSDVPRQTGIKSVTPSPPGVNAKPTRQGQSHSRHGIGTSGNESRTGKVRTH